MKKQAVRRGRKPDSVATQVSTDVCIDVPAKKMEEAGPASVNTVASHEESYAGLLPLLTRLDQRLTAAVEAAEHMFAARASGDLYRGLAISPADVAAAFGRIPGEPFPPLSLEAHDIAEATNSLSLRRLLWLQRVYSLTDLDVDIILIGLASEIDLRYERMYGYLQDDVTRRRPGIDLALNLLCASAGEKLQQRERFAPDAPLLHHRLIEVFVDPHHQDQPLLARFFRLDEQIVRFLLLDDSMDSRLPPFCRMVSPATQATAAPLIDEMQQKLRALALNRPRTGLRLYIEGPAQCGQNEAVSLLASTLDQRVLQADMRQFIASTTASGETLHILVREAWLRGGVLHCNGILSPGEQPATDRLGILWEALKEIPCDVVLQGEAAWIPAASKPLGVVTLQFSYPGTAQRMHWWQRCLEQVGVTLDDVALSSLAQRFRLTYAQIQDAAKVSVGLPSASNSNETSNSSNHMTTNVVTAARAQCGHDLAVLATKINPKATWDDLILPGDAIAQLREVCDRVIHHDRVFNEWGFARKLSRGCGTAALFSGGSGTGKTMAAEVIANDLGVDLYRIDLARMVSKYIGETEKNLDRVFTAAENANAILFFDEADALFGKRSEVKDAHDRYANIEVSYLLQKMEEYEGMSILATNLSDNLDQAFTRRLAFSIHFPFPDEAARLRIWECAWPQGVPLSDSVDRELLARELKMAGGHIKNIALGAAFNAAGNSGIVDMTHMAESARREYQKVGRSNALMPLLSNLKHNSRHTPKAG
jgi:ATP-dependent 26S proteasome regulatory subunit